MAKRKLGHLPAEEFFEVIDERRVKRMAEVDAMPADMRRLVHDYGLTVVLALQQAGVRKTKHMRHIVETVLNEFSPTRGSFSAQGQRALRDGELPIAHRPDRDR
jgi:hypothetical protein